MESATRIIRLPEVMSRTGKSRSTIYQEIKAGKFPEPVKIGKRASGWVESEVEAVNQARIAARGQAA